MDRSPAEVGLAFPSRSSPLGAGCDVVGDVTCSNPRPPLWSPSPCRAGELQPEGGRWERSLAAECIPLGGCPTSPLPELAETRQGWLLKQVVLSGVRFIAVADRVETRVLFELRKGPRIFCEVGALPIGTRESLEIFF